MKTKYTRPITDVINLIAKGYVCAGEKNVMLGGSKKTTEGFRNTGADEAKQLGGLVADEWPQSPNLWD